MEVGVHRVPWALIKLNRGIFLVLLVPQTVSLQLAASAFLPVHVMLDTWAGLEILNVLSVTLALIKLGWGLIRVHIVPLLQCLQVAASQSLHVNVTLGIQEKMKVYVYNVTLVLIKVPCLAHTVPLIQSLQLAAAQSQHVNVTLGTQEKMEARVNNVTLTLIKIQLGMLLVRVVAQTLSLPLAASTSLPVNVVLDTRAKMERNVSSVPLAFIKRGWGLIPVQNVTMFQYIQRVASQALPVNVNLGIHEQMETGANSVKWELMKIQRLAETVRLAQHLRLVAPPS